MEAVTGFYRHRFGPIWFVDTMSDSKYPITDSGGVVKVMAPRIMKDLTLLYAVDVFCTHCGVVHEPGYWVRWCSYCMLYSIRPLLEAS